MTREFDLGQWLESVEGETVVITTPDELGYMASKCYSSQADYNSTYCENCDDYHVLVRFEDEMVGHCPECGRQPGALELGTTRRTA